MSGSETDKRNLQMPYIVRTIGAVYLGLRCTLFGSRRCKWPRPAGYIR